MSAAADPPASVASTGPIAVIGLGGTIAMTAGPQGLVPGLSLADLVRQAGADTSTLRLREMAASSSANLGFDTLVELAGEVAALRASGAGGVVVVQGTDTLEETAFGLELLAGGGTPIAFTGAMRAPSQPGSDGPANLAAAIEAVRSGGRDGGVTVVFNDEIHAARHVAKVHTTAPNAFSSGDHGPIGRLHEGRVRRFGGPLDELGIHAVQPSERWPKVALLKVAFGQEPDLLRALPTLGYDACVLEAMGAGHVPAGLIAELEPLAGRMPVVLCSRTGGGRICERTYGYAGSETDLLNRGLIGAGALTGLKARVALTILLASSAGDPRQAFQALAERV